MELEEIQKKMSQAMIQTEDVMDRKLSVEESKAFEKGFLKGVQFGSQCEGKGLS